MSNKLNLGFQKQKGRFHMAKVAVLLPQQRMCEMTSSMVDQFHPVDIMCLEYIQTEQVADRAKELEAQGCELIVARGVSAAIIKRTVKLPLVEIRVTAQELGMVMLDIKRELGLDRPRVGLLGSRNMFCDTISFDALFGIELHTYLVEQSEELAPAVEQACQDGCHAVVGGDIVCAYAQAIGLPSRLIPAGIESIRTALETASRVCYAIDLEKHDRAEMDTMLNYTFNGIMRVDQEGIIQRVNRAGYDLLGLIPGEVLGRRVTEVLPDLNQTAFENSLRQGKEIYALLLDIQHRAMVVNLAPVCVDGKIDGAILTFQEGRRISKMDSELRRELYQRGHIARYTFANTVHKSQEAQALEKLARRIAKYSAPILLSGERGSGKTTMAQCIHNESLFRDNAFVWLDCKAWLGETLDTMLFGNVTTRKDSPACMAELAQDGTLYLEHVEALPAETQYKLFSLIQGRFLHNGSNRPVAASTRVIASTDANLAAKVEKGEFRSDLYYALSALSLELPPLRRRREDILGWAAVYLGEWQEKYQRYVRLTQGAQQYLQDYDWPGNLEQLNSLCERIVLLTERRNVDEVFIRKQLEAVAPKLLPGTEKAVIYKDPKAAKLAELLRRHGGSRAAVAAELGISKTTLWRYIKKYGIEKDFTY